MAFDFVGIPKRDPFVSIPRKEQISRPEPPPFKYDELDYMREGVGQEVEVSLYPMVRPFLAQGFTSAAALNRGLGVFMEHLDCMADFIEDKTGIKKGGLFQESAEILEHNATYWQNRAQKHGPKFLDELFGEAAGGAIPGVTEFALGVPYAAAVGAAEAHKEDKNVALGALTEAAKRGALGAIFKAILPLKKYLRAPIMGGVFGIQAAGEGAEAREVAKAVGTGMLYSATSPGGKMGLNEIRQNLRRQTGLTNPPLCDTAATLEKLKSDPVAESAHRSRNNIMKIASELRKIKKTDPVAYKKGMTELGKLEASFNKMQQFDKFMESHNKVYDPRLMKKEKIEYSKAGVVELIRNRRRDLNLANYETNLFAHELEKTLTKAERESIPFMIEKTKVSPKLGRLDLEEIVATDSPKLTEVAKKVQTHFNRGWEKIVEQSPEMSAREIENYVTHIWDIPKARKQEITNWFITKNRFLKKRYIENLNEGIEKGLQPKTLDIVDIIRIHDSVTNRTIQNNKLVAELMKLEKSGVPLIMRIDKAPQDWILYDHPALRKKLTTKREVPTGKEEVSTELVDLLKDMGVSIGRKISSKNRSAEAWFNPTKREISLKEKATGRIIGHEIGHFLDIKLGLSTGKFLDRFETELYAINQERIVKYEKTKEEGYVKSSQEQIAEFFAELFTKPEKTMKIAPAASHFVMQEMAKDGTLSRLLDFDFEKNAKNILKEQMLTTTQLPVKVHPDLKKPLDVVFQSTIQHPTIQGYEMINGLLKKTQLSLSLFHHLALSETSVASTGIRKTAGISLNPVKLYQALAKNELDVFKKTDIARDFIEHQGQIGPTQDIPVAYIQKKLDDFVFKTKDVPLMNRTTEFVASFNKQWDKALWSFLHDSLKLYAYESLVAKRVDSKRGDVGKQKQELAQLVNDTFGGQNWDAIMKSPRTLQVARWMLLSPDWTYSTIRQALAPTGIGAIHKETKWLRQKAGTMFWMKAALYYGIGINLVNGAIRAWDEKEHPEFYPESAGPFMWNNTIGHKTHLFLGRYEDGSERYLRWGKQFRELPELFWDSTGGFSPVSASLKKLGGKAAPALQLAAQIFTGHSLSGFRNKEIAGQQGWERVAGVAKALIKSPLPFMSRNLMNEGKEFHLTDMAMPSSKGITRYKAVEYFKTAVYKKDEEMLREVYQDVLRNNLPAHTLFHTALVMVNAESTREYNRGLATIKDVDIRLGIETNPVVIKRLINLRKRMTKENTDRSLGILLLNRSIMELKKHDSLSSND